MLAPIVLPLLVRPMSIEDVRSGGVRTKRTLNIVAKMLLCDIAKVGYEIASLIGTFTTG